MSALEFTLALPGLDAITVGLSRFRTDIADWRPFWDESFAPFFYRNVATDFVLEGGNSGPRWAPLSPAYAAWKQAHYPGRGILERTSALKVSVTSRTGPGAIYRSMPDSLEIGTSVPYAGYHQHGATWSPRPRGGSLAHRLTHGLFHGTTTARLPQRPFLRVDPPFMKVVGKSLQRFVQAAWVKRRDEAAASAGAFYAGNYGGIAGA